MAASEGPYAGCKLMLQGAEAKLFRLNFHGNEALVKERFSKKYRHPQLDKNLTQQRVNAEVRALTRCRMAGIPVPTLYYVDQERSVLIMEYFIDSMTVRDFILTRAADWQTNAESEAKVKQLTRNVGKLLAKMHKENIIHGDLTTSNMLLSDPSDLSTVTLIDFGLSHHENVAEHKGVDLYVLERAFLSTHPGAEKLFADSLLTAYRDNSDKKTVGEVMAKLDEVRMRGRKRTMVG